MPNLTDIKNIETCKSCNKTTEAMYKTNDGLYCENHVRWALANQELQLDLEILKDRINAMRRLHFNIYPEIA